MSAWQTFLLGVGAATALTTLLAVLIVLAEAWIADYGEVEITINDDKKLTVEGGKPLLATLKEQEVFIPSACGGRGSCGLCKLKIHSGAGELLPTETPWLGEEERRSNVRLSCQVKVKRPMRITVPDELFSVRQFRARVARLSDLTRNIKAVTLQLLEPETIDFRAGQFIQLETPPYELTDEPVYRAYSIASSPSDRGSIELEIKYVPDGICTTYVHKYMREGDVVIINGPYGDFGLRETDNRIIMVAGGSGMAPMRSILLHMLETGVSRPTRYYFGANVVADLHLTDLMAHLQKRLPDFSFIPVVWKPGDDETWDGLTGLVTEVLDRELEDTSNTEAYLCGAPAMIDACVKTFSAKGLPEDRIYYDSFS